MKTFLHHACLLCAMLLLPVLCSSKVTWEHDTVFNDGRPYCIMHKTGGITHTFSIRNLRDEEVILVHFVPRVENGQQSGFYAVSFLNDGREGEMGNDINLAKKLAREVVANDLIREGAVYVAGENRFLILYPKRVILLPPPIVVYGGNTYDNRVAERNRSAPVSITGGMIFQDRRHIGDYKERTRAERGTIITVGYYTNPAKEVIAETTIYGVNERGCKLTTARDGRTRIINLKSTFGPEQAVEVAAYLSAQLYL